MINETMVMPTLMSKANQKPKRDKSQGNIKNIGKVGSTYQNVYQA